MTQTDRWYVLNNCGVVTLCVDEHDARKSAAQYDVEYPHHAPHIAPRMHPVADDEQDSTVELRAQVLRLRVALLQCKNLSERVRTYWGNPEAKAISDTVDDALREVE